MKTAIITGVTGQDGGYLAKLLLEQNYRVIGAARSYRCSKNNNLEYLGIADKVEIIELDLTDMANVITVIKKYDPCEIYNLAAQSSVGLSFSQPIGTFSFNTVSINNLLEVIRLINPKIKLYQASSSEMFGDVKQLPININTPMHPVSPYAVSKMAGHFMAMNYRESYNLFICCGILFNHESVLRSDNFFIKKIIRESLQIKNGLQDNIKVGNLNIRRDFGYAPKYVEAMWKMLQQDEAKDFIICSGKSILLKDILIYVFEKLGLDKSLIIEDETLFRPNEIYEIYGDSSEAKKSLNWEFKDSFFGIIDILIQEEQTLMQNIKE